MADPDSPLLRFRLWRAALPPALRLLLTINVGLYVLWVLLSVFAQGEVLLYLALDPTPAALLARPWTPLTYPFVNLYVGFFGLIIFAFAMLWLNWMGRDYEETYGSHRLYGLYVLSVLVGAVVAGALAAGRVPFGHPPYFGAWGPVTAVLCALATLQPNRGIGLFLLGVVPLKWLAVGFVVLDLAFGRDPTHLSAALFGFGFAKAQQGGLDLAAWARPLFRKAQRGYAAYGGGPGGAGVGARVKKLLVRETPEERPGPGAAPRRKADRPARRPAPAGQAEVDRILDKILEDGFDALTDEEKRILNEASRRS
jgi:membrane associated rhomboid family serine protease